jgi:hypothetical protein
MTQVVTFEGYTPIPRFDEIPWTEARVQEAITPSGAWALIDTLTLDPVDTDPSVPATRNLTTDLASDAPNLWYRIVFADANGDTSAPTDPVQNAIVVAEPTLYVQPSALKQTLGIKDSNVDTSYLDADLLASCKSASRAVDKLTDRGPFYAKDLSNDEVRTYTARGPLTLLIDDATAITSVEVDRDDDGIYELTLVEGIDYVLQPTNAPTDGWPWESLRLRSQRSYLMPIGVPAGVKVTGRFGWLETPDQIVDAATIIAAKLFKRKREAPFSIIGVGLDNMAVRIGSYDAEVMMLLQAFDRRLVVA